MSRRLPVLLRPYFLSSSSYRSSTAWKTFWTKAWSCDEAWRESQWLTKALLLVGGGRVEVFMEDRRQESGGSVRNSPNPKEAKRWCPHPTHMLQLFLNHPCSLWIINYQWLEYPVTGWQQLQFFVHIKVIVVILKCSDWFLEADYM